MSAKRCDECGHRVYASKYAATSAEKGSRLFLSKRPIFKAGPVGECPHGLGWFVPLIKVDYDA